MTTEDEKRHGSSKAVAAALMLAGIVFIAIALFFAVIMQRAC